MNRSERKAALLSALYMLGFGIGCYNRSITVIFLVTFCAAVVTTLFCKSVKPTRFAPRSSIPVKTSMPEPVPMEANASMS